MAGSDLQKLIRMTRGVDPRMMQADQFVQNSLNRRGLGPDDPIEWGAFGTQPEPAVPQQSPLFQLLGLLAPTSSASGGQSPGSMDDFLTRILGSGVEGDIAKARQRGLQHARPGTRRL